MLVPNRIDVVFNFYSPGQENLLAPKYLHNSGDLNLLADGEAECALALQGESPQTMSTGPETVVSRMWAPTIISGAGFASTFETVPLSVSSCEML